LILALKRRFFARVFNVRCFEDTTTFIDSYELRTYIS